MALKFTQEQILGLIPAQAIIDFDRAKEVLEKVAKAQEQATAKEILAELLLHRNSEKETGTYENYVFVFNTDDFNRLLNSYKS